jgi:signal transduction histidine kinase
VPTVVAGPAFDLDVTWITRVGMVGLLAGAGLLASGLRHEPRPQFDRLRGSKHWWWLVGIVAVGLSVAISAVARPSVVSSIDLAERTALFVFATTGSLYLLVGHRQRRWLHGWVGLGLMTFSYAELLAAFSGGRMTFLVAAGLLRFIGAGVVLNGVAREMIDAYVAQQQRLFGAVLNLQAIEIGKATTQAREAEIRHDLRSGLLAIQAAMAAFGRTRADSEYLSGTTLTDAVSAEIKRLWSLTDRAGDGEPVVHDLAESLAPTIACHGSLIDLEVSIPEGLMLQGQPDALVGAIVNLLANARTHAPGAAVSVSAARVGPFVEIEVSDDGPGVADNVRPRLFDRGFTTRLDGTGLGLDIALQLTRSQGGDLFCDRPDIGARFRLVLPAAPCASQERAIDLTEPSVTSS